MRKFTTAIKKLIKEYEKNQHNPSTGSCSLCYAAYHNELDSCRFCPNFVFRESAFGMSCVHRIRKYESLDWNNQNHLLVEFWTEVLNLFIELKTEKVTDEVSKGILKIAEKYK